MSTGARSDEAEEGPKRVYARPRPDETLEDLAERFLSQVLDTDDGLSSHTYPWRRSNS